MSDGIFEVGTTFEIDERRAPTFWEWLCRKKVVPYTSVWKVDRVVTNEPETAGWWDSQAQKFYETVTYPDGRIDRFESDSIFGERRRIE